MVLQLNPNYHTIADFRKYMRAFAIMFRLYSVLGDAGLLGKTPLV
jgi:hypothetical protein